MKKHLLLLIVAATSINSIAIEKKRPLKGYWVSPKIISKDMTLFRAKPTEKQISRYVRKINPLTVFSEVDNAVIAKNIIKISKCFEIDPWVFTGLIKKESSFRIDAVSPTGAAGFTQFTGIGIKEVHDQLGLNGSTAAHRKNIRYFNHKIKKCVNKDWVQVWDRLAVAQEHEDFNNEVKEVLKSDVETSLVYGAILLKVYLGRITELNKELRTSETYFKALQFYNGEPGEAKVNYAKVVMKSAIKVYPAKVKFDFLK